MVIKKDKNSIERDIEIENNKNSIERDIEIENNKNNTEKQDKLRKAEYSRQYRKDIKNGDRHRIYKTKIDITKEYFKNIEKLRRLENKVLNLRIKLGLNKESVVFSVPENKRIKNDDVDFQVKLMKERGVF